MTFAIAALRHGGAGALDAKLTGSLGNAELAAIPEDRWLSMLTRCVFRAGFSWKLVDAKWDGFDTDRCAFMDDDEFDTLLRDASIVRNGTKIATVREKRGLPA